MSVGRSPKCAFECNGAITHRMASLDDVGVLSPIRAAIELTREPISTRPVRAWLAEQIACYEWDPDY
jgi:hypothetical protein